MGGRDGDFDSHVGAWEESGGFFAEEDGGLAGEVEGVRGVVVGDDEADEGVDFEVSEGLVQSVSRVWDMSC